MSVPTNQFAPPSQSSVSRLERFLFFPLAFAIVAYLVGQAWYLVDLKLLKNIDPQDWGFGLVMPFYTIAAFIVSEITFSFIRSKRGIRIASIVLVSALLLYPVCSEVTNAYLSNVKTKHEQNQKGVALQISLRAQTIGDCDAVTALSSEWPLCVYRTYRSKNDLAECQRQQLVKSLTWTFVCSVADKIVNSGVPVVTVSDCPLVEKMVSADFTAAWNGCMMRVIKTTSDVNKCVSLAVDNYHRAVCTDAYTVDNIIQLK